jgi:hypothetical protein
MAAATGAGAAPLGGTAPRARDVAAVGDTNERWSAVSHESGAVTPGYKADRDKVVKLLNEALATEIVCVLRYKRHFFMASGLNAKSVAAEFLEHANEEQGHADGGAWRAHGLLCPLASSGVQSTFCNVTCISCSRSSRR